MRGTVRGENKRARRNETFLQRKKMDPSGRGENGQKKEKKTSILTVREERTVLRREGTRNDNYRDFSRQTGGGGNDLRERLRGAAAMRKYQLAVGKKGLEQKERGRSGSCPTMTDVLKKNTTPPTTPKNCAQTKGSQGISGKTRSG